MDNNFFLKNVYDTEIDLETNEDVLERIYEDNISMNDKLNINFAFITNTKEKAEYFSEKLEDNFKNYTDIQVDIYGDVFEISGVSDEIQMTLKDINKWNREMWDFGYQYDCKLDGWFVEGN